MSRELIQADLPDCDYCGEKYWNISSVSAGLLFCCNCGNQIEDVDA